MRSDPAERKRFLCDSISALIVCLALAACSSGAVSATGDHPAHRDMPPVPALDWSDTNGKNWSN
ncbi:MAG: hypothetical protein GX131_13595 [candidate division WS1 bacterium]|jgi:hypothetical protein|nr:hypothetical protein [candidate division WS1 bacterium]